MIIDLLRVGWLVYAFGILVDCCCGPEGSFWHPCRGFTPTLGAEVQRYKN